MARISRIDENMNDHKDMKNKRINIFTTHSLRSLEQTAESVGEHLELRNDQKNRSGICRRSPPAEPMIEKGIRTKTGFCFNTLLYRQSVFPSLLCTPPKSL
jgi:hypothetical protein